MSDDKKKKKGFFSRAFGRKSKDEKLAETAALKVQRQADLDEKMAQRMAAINAAALKSAREMDEQAGIIEPAADQAATEQAERVQAEAQAQKDVERAKQLAIEIKENEKKQKQEAAEQEAQEKQKLETEALQAQELMQKELAAKKLAKKEQQATDNKAKKAVQKQIEAERLAKEQVDKALAETQQQQKDQDLKQEAEKLAANAKAEVQAQVQVQAEKNRLAASAKQAQVDLAKTNQEQPAATTDKKRPGFLKRISLGLKKSTAQMSDNMTSLFTKRKLDAEALEELEDLLIAADLGVGPAMRTTQLLAQDKFDKQISPTEIKIALADVIGQTLAPVEKPLTLIGAKPEILLFVGVNGSGKTTTLGKLAAQYTQAGKKVLLCAGDTFRAAAVEQLKVWGDRAGAPVVSAKLGADAAGLVFDAIKRARDESYDILMIDTAGRLQNRTELMDELSKIVRVIQKHDESAPHHSILVLDATVGQNALSQTEVFSKTANVSGLIMTKLDGTAKGGVLVALADKFKLPIHAIGIGEHIDDLENFSASVFAAALSGIADAVMDENLEDAAS